jgi:hypothetical protein
MAIEGAQCEAPSRICRFTIRAAELDALDRFQIAYKLLKKNTNLTNPRLA